MISKVSMCFQVSFVDYLQIETMMTRDYFVKVCLIHLYAFVLANILQLMQASRCCSMEIHVLNCSDSTVDNILQ